MFTVLIAEKHYIDAIRLENKLFFEPFLENKELAFCQWNPMGQNLKDSVPELIDTVGRKKEWRAVIINEFSTETSKRKNPFDVVEFGDINFLTQPPQTPDEGESWDEWEQKWSEYYTDLTKGKESVYRSSLEFPLQKLATWLSFRPEDYILNDVSEKDDIYDWALNEIGHREINPAVRLEKLEREQYRTELKLKELLRREFVSHSSFDIAYPREIYCISERTSDKDFFNPESYWNIRSKNEYSEFCDRNMYFDKMRFLVFDILPQTHKDYRCEKIKFLWTLLIFASNAVPASTMEARRLYVLECNNDDKPLFTLVTSYDKKLAATYEVIDNEIERIYSEIPGVLTDKAAEAMFCTSSNVEVNLDESCDFDSLYSEVDFDLIPSSVEEETSNWQQSFSASKKSYANIIRQQRRAVKKGVDRLIVSSELSPGNVRRLTPFQLDDIREFTENAENEMVSSIPPDLTKTSKHDAIMQEKSEAIKDVISKRMTRLKAIIVGAIILFLTSLLYVPFIVANLSGTKSTTVSLTMLGIMGAILGVALFVALIFLKFPLKSAVRDFDDTMRNVADDINGNMKAYSRYFSLSCNVTRGYKVQSFARGNLDEYTKSIRIRRKHQEDIRKIRAHLDEMYRDFIGDSQYYENSMIQPYDYDFEKKIEYSYPAPFMAGFCRNIAFLESGNPVEVPMGYITEVMVRKEEIYDR